MAIDHEQCSLAETIALAIGAIALGDFTFGLKIGKQWKMKVEMLGKSIVTPDTINGNPKDLRPIFFKFREGFIIERHLISADWAPVGGIKGNDHGLASEIAEREPLIRRNWQRELGSLRSADGAVWSFYLGAEHSGLT